MKHKIIHSNPTWRSGPGRYDCTFVTTDPMLSGMEGLDVVCILMFFSFVYLRTYYLCAVVCWFVHGDVPDEDTGIWVVRPGFNARHQPNISVVYLDMIYCATHLVSIIMDNSSRTTFTQINHMINSVCTMSINMPTTMLSRLRLNPSSNLSLVSWVCLAIVSLFLNWFHCLVCPALTSSLSSPSSHCWPAWSFLPRT